MVARHITLQCQLFIPMLLEKELDVACFMMDLPKYHNILHTK